MRSIIIFFGLCLLLTSCGGGSKNAWRYEEIDKDTSLYAVIPYNSKDTLNNWRLAKGSGPADLSEKEIQEIDSLLTVAVDGHNNNPNPKSWTYSKIGSLSKYKRQLVPTINEKGEKMVWMNCLCNETSARWRKQIMIWMDGGNCYFNFTINLTLKTWSLIEVNGYG